MFVVYLLERFQKFLKTEDSTYICQNELDKSCFQRDIAYVDFKDLPRRMVFKKVFNIIMV